MNKNLKAALCVSGVVVIFILCEKIMEKLVDKIIYYYAGWKIWDAKMSLPLSVEIVRNGDEEEVSHDLESDKK